MNRIKQVLNAIALQKLKKNFWSVFSFGIIMAFLLGSFSEFDFSPHNSGNEIQKQNQSFNFLPTSTTNQIIQHDYYTLSYSEKHEQAEWVAYELKKSYVRSND